jgi:predicted nucleotidyltransferase
MTILFKTQLRKKLLAYSFTHPGENFYVRELAGLIDADAGNLSRELRALEKEGLFTSFSRGRERFYSLNKAYPLFEEFKQIIFKTEGVEGAIKDLLSKHDGISAAFIYGSYAKNREKKASDIDLVIVGKFPQDELTREIRSLESKLNREVNFTSYSDEEFRKEREKKGGFLNLVLKERIAVLKGDLNVR